MNSQKTRLSIIKKTLLLCIGFILVNQVANAQIAMTKPVQLQPKQSLISVNFVRTPLPKALHTIAQKAHVGLSYKTSVVPSDPITYQAEEIPVYNVLDKVLKGTDLYYELSKSHKVILIKQQRIQLHSLIVEQPDPTVSGTVTNAKTGQPMIGVNILVVGTTIGTVTNVNGHYSLTVPSLQDSLRFSFIGFKTQTVAINGRTIINIELAPSVISGQQMVVIGYGKQKKIDLTGAVVSVSGEDLKNQNVVNPAAMLQGMLPGLRVVQSSGQPGSGVSMMVRGFGTFSGAGVEPLVLIDGIPGDLSSLNPHAIKSVTLLKDAASAAIYGSRAANGVILVTTKDGHKGETTFSYDFSIGRYTPTVLPNLVWNSAKYMKLYNIASRNSGVKPIYTKEEIQNYAQANGTIKYPSFNWVDFMVNPAYVRKHHISLRGGSDRTTYYVGLGYMNQPGTIPPYHYKKYNARINVESQATNRIKFGINLGVNYDVTNDAGGEQLYQSILAQGPMYRPTLPDGRYTRQTYQKETQSNRFNENPYARSKEIDSETRAWRVQANTYIKVDLLKNLEWMVKAGVNMSNSKSKVFDGKFAAYNYQTGTFSAYVNTNSLQVSHFRDMHPILFTHLTYKKDFGKHSFSVLAGYQVETYKYETNSLGRDAYIIGTTQQIDAGPVASQTNGGNSKEWALMSYFGRINYNFEHKYLLEINFRADGSSRFAPGNRWGFFPSASAGWRISEEPFLEDVDWLTNLKIRGSYGVLGNQDIAYYPYQTVLAIGGGGGAVYPLYGNGGKVVTTVVPTDLVNKDIKWETTTIADIGLDMSLFQSRLNLTVDWYNKITSDILRHSQVPLYLGRGAPIVNDGKLKNTGFEFNIDYSNNIGSVFYTVGGNIQHFHNELIKFGEPEIGSTTIKKEGLPWNTWHVLKWVGIFQSKQEIKNSAKQQPAPQPGSIKYKDVNGDGIINSEDKINVEGAFPDFSYGFHISMNWKNFDFYARFFGVAGVRKFLYWQGNMPFYEGTPPRQKWVNGRWTPDHHTNKMPLIYHGQDYNQIFASKSTYFLENTSYLRLQNVRLSYTLPASIVHKIGLKSVRIYYSGQNLLTFTPIDGYDPERSYKSGVMAEYPQNTINSLGINIKF